MRVIVLDGKKMTDIPQTHRYIAEEASFPEYYGRNLDALADCLSELGKNTCIVLMNPDDMRKNLRGYARRILGVMEYCSSEYGFDFVICGEE